MSDTSQDRRAIACNAVEDTSAYRKGAIAYVQQFAGDRAEVLIRSRGGRRITAWVSMNKLTNFRFKTIPPQHPLYEKVVSAGNWYDEETIKELNTKESK